MASNLKDAITFDEYIQTYFKHVVLKYSCNKVKELHIIKH
jgi:hypothetical protein